MGGTQMKFEYFTGEDAREFKKAFRITKGAKAKDIGPGRALDVALKVYQRNFMPDGGGDVPSRLAGRVGIAIGSRKGSPDRDPTIKAIESIFNAQTDRSGCGRG
jgi:hypothetical protein